MGATPLGWGSRARARVGGTSLGFGTKPKFRGIMMYNRILSISVKENIINVQSP